MFDGIVVHLTNAELIAKSNFMFDFEMFLLFAVWSIPIFKKLMTIFRYFLLRRVS